MHLRRVSRHQYINIMTGSSKYRENIMINSWNLCACDCMTLTMSVFCMKYLCLEHLLVWTIKNTCCYVIYTKKWHHIAHVHFFNHTQTQYNCKNCTIFRNPNVIKILKTQETFLYFVNAFCYKNRIFLICCVKLFCIETWWSSAWIRWVFCDAYLLPWS